MFVRTSSLMRNQPNRVYGRVRQGVNISGVHSAADLKASVHELTIDEQVCDADKQRLVRARRLKPDAESQPVSLCQLCY